jgi:hypothetical protein
MTPSRLLRQLVLLVPAVLALYAAPLAAQTFEAGGSIAASCIGSDGSGCSEGGLRTVGPAASVWFGDRVEVGGRVIWFELRDLTSSLNNGPVTYEVATIDRERRIAQGCRASRQLGRRQRALCVAAFSRSGHLCEVRARAAVATDVVERRTVTDLEATNPGTSDARRQRGRRLCRNGGAVPQRRHVAAWSRRLKSRNTETLAEGGCE